MQGLQGFSVKKRPCKISLARSIFYCKVFFNDEEIEYTVGDELSEVGEYKVVVTDACGNATEYTFNIEKGANIGLWVILGILALAGIGVGVFFYIKKKNSI